MDIQSAQLPTTALTWSDGTTKFSGYLLLVLLLPTGYTTAAFANKYPRQNLPLRVKVPISQGIYDQNTQVLYNTSIDPPNTQYVAYMFDANDIKIAGPSSAFTVSASPVSVPALTLTTPSVGSVTPVP